MTIRLNKVIKEFNVGLQTVVDFLQKKGHEVSAGLNQRITDEQYELLRKEFGADKDLRTEAEKMLMNRQKEKQKEKVKKPAPEVIETSIPEELRPQLTVKGSIDLNAKGTEKTGTEMPVRQEEKVAAEQPEKAQTEKEKSAAQPEAVVSQPETAAQPEEKAAVQAAVASEEKHAPAAAAPVAEQTAEAAPAAAGQDHASEKKAKHKLSVEERAKAIGEESDGVFKLRTHPELSGPKVLGTIDLSTLNQTTRPKKKQRKSAARNAKRKIVRHVRPDKPLPARRKSAIASARNALM